MSLFPLSSLSDLYDIDAALPNADGRMAKAAKARQEQLTKPPGSLGRLEELAVFMAGWQGREKPRTDTAQALVFAGNHGICAQGVNPFPQDVTAQMVANFAAGGAAINQLCAAFDAELSVMTLDLDTPTADFTVAPAMNGADCLAAINRGAAAVAQNADILVLGEMGIGNSTIAAALCAGVFGGEVSGWVGPGTGSDADGIARKVKTIEAGLELHKEQLDDPVAVLCTLGGREQAAIAGAVLAAREARIPVMLDGFICTASVAPLYALAPGLLDHCLVAHVSAEPGHQLLLEALGKEALLALNMRLGEGSGAALALGILRGALACHNGMATFAEAGVASA